MIGNCSPVDREFARLQFSTSKRTNILLSWRRWASCKFGEQARTTVNGVYAAGDYNEPHARGDFAAAQGTAGLWLNMALMAEH